MLLDMDGSFLVSIFKFFVLFGNISIFVVVVQNCRTVIYLLNFQPNSKILFHI